jgi:hypothetical protein
MGQGVHTHHNLPNRRNVWQRPPWPKTQRPARACSRAAIKSTWPKSQQKTPLAFTNGVFAEWTGLEPATSCVTGRHSNRLNYHSEPLLLKEWAKLLLWQVSAKNPSKKFSFLGHFWVYET